MVRRGAPRVDEANECIWWGDRRVDLVPKAFLVLRRLMRHPNQIVTKNDLLDAAWPDTHVGDGVLMVAINQLREAFGDDSRQPRFIETLRRRGYRWIGEIQVSGIGSVSGMEDLPTPGTRHSTPDFVGRDAALAQLEHALSRAVGRSRQMVFVTGQPGIGKTSLVEQFTKGLVVTRQTTRTPVTPPLILRGQCVDGFGSSEAYMPLLEPIERLCRESDNGEMLALLRRVAPMWLLQFPRLLQAGEQDELHRLLAGSTAERMVRELLNFIEELSAERTLVVVLEDLHWSDHATIGALAAVAMRREPARLLMIASYRPADAIAEQHPISKLKHELTAKGQCTTIALEGLSTDAVGAYLAGRFPNHRLPPDLASDYKYRRQEIRSSC